MEIQERYEIRRKLGQGGVGTVHEGYDRQLKRKVAIKRLVADDSKDSKDSVEELLRECHSLSALNSPNIVSLYDFGEDGDGPLCGDGTPRGRNTRADHRSRSPLPSRTSSY